MQSSAIRGYRFAEFTLDLGRRRLSRGDESLPLSGRAFEVLAYLLAQRERMVSKRELLEAVWPRMVVEENNLTQAISQLRRALGDSRESPRFIATVAGRGYQFVGDAAEMLAEPTLPPPTQAPPEAAAATEPPAAPPAPGATIPAGPGPGPVAPAPASVAADTSGAPSPTRRRVLFGAAGVALGAVAGSIWWSRRDRTAQLPSSIAVLPFKPLLADARNEAIEIGMAELLINRLSTLPDIVVTPLSSVRRFAAVDQDPLQAGRSLDVAAVVDGTVQMQHGRVRLTARLLDVASGRSLWAGEFTEDVGDFFAVQDALVTQLVAALAVDIPADVRRRLVAHTTTNSEAWQLYANGRYQLERREPDAFRRAREFFEAAIELDPRFALAFTGLSEAWVLSNTFAMVPPGPAFQQARAAAQRALEIDPQLPEALTALGHVFTQYDRDWAGARALYRKSLELAPNAGWTHAFLALNLVQSGPIREALDHIERAQRLEPAAVPFMALGGFLQYHAREFDGARRRLQVLFDSAPEAALPRHFLARVLLAQGDAAGALRLLEDWNKPAPGSYSTLGRAHAALGQVDQARAELARVEGEGTKGFGVAFDLALLHLALGDRERALDALERAPADRSQMVGYLHVEPALDPIRNEPRLHAVARAVGLPEKSG
jgi:DNA-binding winged helix-turn-helix (wHTH) protein/TolB-like protein/Tfp pilus assembly protein PilF